MVTVRVAFAAVALSSMGACVTYDEVPLATGRIEGVMPCVGCRDPAAVVVTVTGDDALPDAVIVVHDLRVMYDLGQRPAAVVRADADGRWRTTVRALRTPGRAELPVLAGDVFELFQKDGEGDASTPYRITVPAPAAQMHPEVPVIEPEPQAAGPVPDPAAP